MRQISPAGIQLTDKEIDAALRVLRSGYLRQGLQCDAFEREFAAKSGAKFGVACASGSAALHLAYMASLRPGDEVLVPAFTFIATASMVNASACRPIFCDVDPHTFLIDLDDAASKVTDRTRAIVPVHLFGNVVNVEAVRAFASKHELITVWDAAQAHGASYQGQDVGAFGEFVAYSFYPTKNMFVGEGGMTLTDNADYAQKLRLMRAHGQSGKYHHTMFGFNYRMTDVEAAIGREQLKRLDAMLELRRRNADVLSQASESLAGIRQQGMTPGTKHAWHQFCVVVDPRKAGITRDELQARLKDQGVSAAIHYPRGLHQQPVYREMYGQTSLPVTERLAETILALPVHHGLNEADIAYVAKAVVDSVKSSRK